MSTHPSVYTHAVKGVQIQNGGKAYETSLVQLAAETETETDTHRPASPGSANEEEEGLPGGVKQEFRLTQELTEISGNFQQVPRLTKKHFFSSSKKQIALVV